MESQLDNRRNIEEEVQKLEAISTFYCRSFKTGKAASLRSLPRLRQESLPMQESTILPENLSTGHYAFLVLSKGNFVE
jgi:hypothetical protein